jgi:hypothetical protein
MIILDTIFVFSYVEKPKINVELGQNREKLFNLLGKFILSF